MIPIPRLDGPSNIAYGAMLPRRLLVPDLIGALLFRPAQYAGGRCFGFTVQGGIWAEPDGGTYALIKLLSSFVAMSRNRRPFIDEFARTPGPSREVSVAKYQTAI